MTEIVVIGSKVYIDGLSVSLEEAERMYQEYLDGVERDPAWVAFGKYLDDLRKAQNETD